MANRIVGDLTIVERVAQHEEAVAELYELFAARLPKQAAFWRDAAADERTHADVLRQLKAEIEQQRISLKPERFNLMAIKISQQFVANHLARTMREGVTEERALQIAEAIESETVEVQTFDIFAHECPYAADAFIEINTCETRHRNQLRAALDARQLTWGSRIKDWLKR